ncbi:MAG: class II aldolase/adducin family protein [Planctomycetes bacterium]|nr:class II aldolase/adducin family protein [Planctomycetota bacterium]
MEWQLRQEMVSIGKRIDDRRLVAATDGNISARLHGGRILMTPSGIALGSLRPQDLVIIDHAGRLLSGTLKKSSEFRLHLMIYEERRDVVAVVHAHPPIANAFTFAGVPLDPCIVPEVVATLGSIPTTDYGTPATDEGANVARTLIANHDAIMLQRHGSVTVGPTLLSAYQKLEKLEHTAEVLLAAHQLGGPKKLSKDEILKLARLREDLGIGCGVEVLRACGLDE